jgi:hypothetical protein
LQAGTSARAALRVDRRHVRQVVIVIGIVVSLLVVRCLVAPDLKPAREAGPTSSC